MTDAEDLLICKTCATQFDAPASNPLPNCRICDDPRQYVPSSGQQWSSLRELRGKYENKWKEDPDLKGVWSIWTEPKFGIGQRAFLIETPEGNVLWDLIAFLDQPTIDFINSKGGLKAIVISHPHYYTTHPEWARTFNCPVYISAEDEEWVNRAASATAPRRLITEPTLDVVPGVTAIKTGGHFPGSLVLLWKKELFIADSIVTVPSGLYFKDRPPGTTSYTFMWSIPNMIPLPPSEVMKMWKAIAPYEFEATHGAFLGMDVRRPDAKKAVLESMKIQVKFEGHENHAILNETCA
ncbi:uncharacterized protein K452DRAFT_218692 [Aplosporella prunicola CBS 121167]|uniref:Metallo-beta-lactamase domain-containing protein n=1 Tax=Aplosporella prunicola CBS 121167 TaxID=1176127 RepID=A0A6A6BVT5_9PEZI|nr:uncharacterized protein K452DRAFT_218692 [Aplosporella prunicola CBS 121167]KAF2146811.1 hypothetical protein K452DRAFT_218692 [Aplosporella prunicola CBS 121167]